MKALRAIQTAIPYIVTAAVVAVLFAWPRSAPPPQTSRPAKGAEAPAPARVVEAVRRDMIETFETTGVGASWADIRVVAPIDGAVSELHADIGDRVAQGQVLAVLDGRLLQADLKQAEAALARSDENLGWIRELASRQIDIRLLQAELQQAEAAAARSAEELQRIEQLAARGLADRNRVYAAAEQAATGRAAAETLQKRLTLTRFINPLDGTEIGRDEQSRLREALSQQALDRAAVDRLRAVLDLTRFVSPIAGVVRRRSVEVGESVQSGGEILTLSDVSRMRILANVPEAMARNLRVGAAAVARVDGAGESPFPAAVRRVRPTSDPMSHQVEVELDAGDVFPRLAPGYLASVVFTTNERKNALTLDRRVLPAISGSEAEVLRVDGDRLQRRRITLGLILEDRVEILSGLRAGDRVALGGRLREDAAIEVIEVVDAIRQ